MNQIMQLIFPLVQYGKELMAVNLLVELFVRFSRAYYNLKISDEPTFFTKVSKAFTMESTILKQDLYAGFLPQPISYTLRFILFLGSAVLTTFAVRVLLDMPSSIDFILRTLVFVGITATAKSSYFRKRELGYALAWSYYIGYLKFILPKITAGPNIFVDDGGEQHNVDGLFILVPVNCKIPGKVEEGEKIVYEGEHFTLAENVAGIVGRQYKQSVYKVYGRAGDDDFYCYVEYATPLRHLYAMSTRSEKYHHESGLSEAEMGDQVNLFTHTLHELLSLYHTECFCPPKDSQLALKDFVQFVKLEDEDQEIAQAIRKCRWNMKLQK